MNRGVFERARVGGVCALDGSPRLEIGYWVRTSFEGQGLVTEAVRAPSRLAFDRLQTARVEIRMDAENASSHRVAERAGFTFEGVLRRDTLAQDGALRDTCAYSLVLGNEERGE